MRNGFSGLSIGSGILLSTVLGAPWWTGTSLLMIVAVARVLTTFVREIFPQESADRVLVLLAWLMRPRGKPATGERRGVRCAGHSAGCKPYVQEQAVDQPLPRSSLLPLELCRTCGALPDLAGKCLCG